MFFTFAVLSATVFLLREVSLVIGESIEADTWREIADAAAAADKDSYAEEARRMAARADS